MKKSIVIGSGLAGLTAAYRLQQQGRDVLVLEATDRTGGRVLSFEKNGFIVDAGPTLITDQYTEYLKLVEELELSHLLVDSSPQIAVVGPNGLNIIDASRPLRAFLATRALTPVNKLKLAIKGLQLIKPLSGLNPYELSSHIHYDRESMGTYLDRVFGRELNEQFLAAIARGVTLSTPSEASVIEFFAGAVAAAGKMQNLKGGLGLLLEQLGKRLTIQYHSKVNSVVRTDTGIRVNYTDAHGNSIDQAADDCVITCRFRDAVEIFPELKESGARLYAQTDYTGCYSMQLFYDCRPEKEPFIIMVPESISPEVSAVFLEHVKAPDRAPEGKSQITLFFNLQSKIDFANWSDDEFVKTGRSFIEQLFPELTGHYLDYHLTRWNYAAHLGNVGYYKALEEFKQNHSASDPVQLAGDWMSVSGQESAVIAGVNAAKRLLSR